MTLEFGKSKPCVDVTLEEALRHPIWQWAIDEETIPGQDETWTKPVTNTTDVGDELVDYYPTITFAVVGTALYGTGDYDNFERQLFQFRVWQSDSWHELRDIDGLSAPVIFEAVPSILGKAGVRFCCNSLDDWKAERIDNEGE